MSEAIPKPNSAKQSGVSRRATLGASVKPVRVTVDLVPLDYEALRNFAHDARMSHADVIRALIRLLQDASVATEVRTSVDQ